MSANTEWATIVRKLESELAEARCTDPDHYAINAERSEARGLRKAWIKLDDQRQTLERELAEVTESLRKAIVWAEAASHRITDRQNINWTYLNEARATLEAMQNGGAA